MFVPCREKTLESHFKVADFKTPEVQLCRNKCVRFWNSSFENRPSEVLNWRIYSLKHPPKASCVGCANNFNQPTLSGKTKNASWRTSVSWRGRFRWTCAFLSSRKKLFPFDFNSLRIGFSQNQKCAPQEIFRFVPNDSLANTFLPWIFEVRIVFLCFKTM